MKFRVMKNEWIFCVFVKFLSWGGRWIGGLFEEGSFMSFRLCDVFVVLLLLSFEECVSCRYWEGCVWSNGCIGREVVVGVFRSGGSSGEMRVLG